MLIATILYLLGVVSFFHMIEDEDYRGKTPMKDFLWSWVWPVIAILIGIVTVWNLIIQRR